MAAPLQVGNKAFTFADPQEEERKRRMAWGKAQGLDDATIQKYELIGKVQQQLQAQKQTQQTQQPQQQPQSKKATGLKRLLIQGGALGAQALAGVGSLAAAPFTGGASLAAGFGAGVGINALKDKLLGEKQSLKGNLLEGGLTILPGVGKLAKEGVTGFKGARLGEEALAAAKAAKSVAPEKQALKDVLLNSVKTPKEGGRLTKVSNAIKKTSTGAMDVSEGFKAGENATKRLATVQQYGIGGGRRGLQKGAEVLSNLENELQPILKKTKIPVKNVSGVLDNVAKYSEAEVTDPLMKRVLASQNKALQNAAKDGVISGDELRTIRSKLGNGIFQGAETGSKDLKKEIYRAYGDLIGEKAPKARSILTQQHDILGLEKGLAKRAEGARIPLLGGALTKSPVAGQARDLGLDFAANVTGKVGKVTGNPVIKTGVQQALARSFLKPGFETPQDQNVPGQTQLPQDTSQVFANPQSQDEADLNQLISSGVTDPQELFDQLNAPTQTDQQPENPLGMSSADLIKQAYDLRVAGDAKGSKDILEFAKVAQQFEQDAAKGKGGGLKLSDTAITKMTDLQNGIQHISELGDQVTNNYQGGPITGRVRSLNPFDASFKNQQSDIDAVRQLVGKAKEGGVLRKEDEEKYKKILPTLNDPPETVRYKIKQIATGLQSDLERYLMNQQQFGKGSTDISNLFSNSATNTQGVL